MSSYRAESSPRGSSLSATESQLRFPIRMTTHNRAPRPGGGYGQPAATQATARWQRPPFDGTITGQGTFIGRDQR